MLLTRLLLVATSFLFVQSIGLADSAPSLDPYNVVWTSPSDNSRGSMPVGNGDIGVNAWVESGGDLLFYVSKTDAWGDDLNGSYGLPKVGRVRLHLDPNPFAAGSPFLQTLKLSSGEIQIQAGSLGSTVKLNLWVDANAPVIHVDGTSVVPEKVTVSIDTYRTTPDNGLNADTILPATGSSVSWCYANGNQREPALRGLTFGALINGEGLVSTSNTDLISQSPQTAFHVRVFPLTTHSGTANEWMKAAESLASANKTDNHTYSRHIAWWRDFWNRSWIVATGDDDANAVTRAYILQRFVTACSGRGAFPIKFNGSIFTTDYTVTDDNNGVRTSHDVDADYRAWGGQYWFQNTRAMYWPMLQSGDFDMMQPLFNMYFNKLPDAKKQVMEYYGHPGAYFAETNPFWSNLPNIRPGETPSWTMQYYTPILELTAMMFDYYDYTGDKKFLENTLLPIIDSGLTFYANHFQIGADGKLNMSPDNSIETFWGVYDPAPDIAGLDYDLQMLLALPQDLTTSTERSSWLKIQSEVPALPIGQHDGVTAILPYTGFTPDSHTRNVENPELYAVYPFRLYGLGLPSLELARDTYAVRLFKGANCWVQDPIQAAYLGETDDARKYVVQDFADSSRDKQERFPVFWGPFHDYTPDEDNGGNGMNALQLMLLQSVGNKLILVPAWPKDWDATFKLNAPSKTTVVCTVKSGVVTSLKVTPKDRQKDIYLVTQAGELKPYN